MILIAQDLQRPISNQRLIRRAASNAWESKPSRTEIAEQMLLATRFDKHDANFLASVKLAAIASGCGLISRRAIVSRGLGAAHCR